MFKTILTRSVATTAALGSALALAGLSAPLTVSPAIQNMACDSYQGCSKTRTVVDLDLPVAEHGAVNRITVTVTTGGRGVSGRAVVTIERNGSFEVPVSNGQATLRVPRRLAAGNTYTVRARFPEQGSYDNSGDTTYLTVKKARTSISGLAARSIRRGGHPTVSGTVVASTGVRPRGGSVLVQLFRKGSLVKDTTVAVQDDGTFSARFGRTFKRGLWSAEATFSGTRNFRSAGDTDGFRVR